MSVLDNLPAIKEQLQKKNDQQLLDILYYSQDDWDKDVISLIEEILLERGFTNEDIAKAKDSYNALVISIKQAKTNLKAGFWIRACNYIIDHSFVYYIIGYSFQIIFHDMIVADKDSYYALMIGAYILYYTATVYLLNGTFGMVLIGLRVKTDKDKKVTFGHSLARSVYMVLNFLILSIGHLWIFSEEKTTLVDRWSGTKVVYK